MAIKPNLIIENSIIKVRNQELIDDSRMTYLYSAATAASGTLTVDNISGAALSGYMILGEVNSEKTEIVQIHAATAPSGTTITLASNTVYAHPADTPVYFIDYYQVEFSRATVSAGTKTVLSTVTVTPDSEFTRYADTNTTGYAYIRFANGSTYSQYSDEQEYSSLGHNSVSNIIDSVFDRANEKTEDFITREMVLKDYIWGYINKVSELKTRWKHEESDEDTSNETTIGGETFDLPSDMKYPDQKSIMCISMEGYEPLTYISLVEWRKKIVGLGRTTLDGDVSAAATTVDLIDASNFPSASTGYIGGDEFAWTGITANQLTGVTGILAHDSGDVVWDDGSLGLPEYYTIQNGAGRLFAAPSDDYDGMILAIDYYKELTRPDSENDILPIPYIEPCKDYCAMRVEQKRKQWTAASELKGLWETAVVQVIKNERTGTSQYISPKE